MGWTFYNATHYTKNGSVDRKSECDAIIKYNNAKISQRVLKSAMVGSIYYAAVEIINKETQHRCVIAAVILTSSDKAHGYNFGYKDLTETMGPSERKCPASILNLLTETDNEYAKKWREDCRKYNMITPLSKLPIGTVISYKTCSGETRRLIKRAAAYQFKRPFWYCPDDNTYSSSKNIPTNYEIISTGN